MTHGTSDDSPEKRREKRKKKKRGSLLTKRHNGACVPELLIRPKGTDTFAVDVVWIERRGREGENYTTRG